MSVFVIAEAGSCHDNELSKAYRLIESAKACGADAVKFQWTSDAHAMAQRRGMDAFQAAACEYGKYLVKPVEWLHQLKAHADKVGIEFMCTVYLKQDIAVVAPLVKLFKVSAYEAEWREFISDHCPFEKGIIISVNDGMKRLSFCQDSNFLYCVSKYPTRIEELKLRERHQFDGLSDHTTSTLTGAVAVGCGATIIEKHIRLSDTSPQNPDYWHSLVADGEHGYLSDPGKTPAITWDRSAFWHYVANVREAEKML